MWEAYPAAWGVLFDRSHAIEQGRQYLERAALAHRCECIAGDFFEAVPGGGDAYVLKSIIHNWNDAQSTIILGHCRRVMPAGAKLLLVELIMPECLGVSTADQERVRSDLQMLLATSAHERTEAEYRALLTSTGFQVTKIVPVEGSFSLLEATPA
jgi:orsellinic acid C2-O-methyltransferase